MKIIELLLDAANQDSLIGERYLSIRRCRDGSLGAGCEYLAEITVCRVREEGYQCVCGVGATLEAALDAAAKSLLPWLKELEANAETVAAASQRQLEWWRTLRAKIEQSA